MFPSGRSGAGLLLLRLALVSQLSVPAMMTIGAALRDTWRPDLVAGAMIGILRIVCALLVGVGFLTPLAQIAFVLAELPFISPQLASGALEALPQGDLRLFSTLVAIGLALVGPGAYSIDARIFGRRKIVIPARPQPLLYSDDRDRLDPFDICHEESSVESDR